MRLLIIFILSSFFIISCSSNRKKQIKENGISLNQNNSKEDEENLEKGPFKELVTRPTSVINTGHQNFRLTTVYKINYNYKTEEYFTGTNRYHKRYVKRYRDEFNYESIEKPFLPGLEALYGYNLMNIGHYNIEQNKRKNLFDKDVLINTLYYPSLEADSIKNEPIKRDYYLVSVYDEDTNKDSLINQKDLRRFYQFDIEGNNPSLIIPKDYSVMNCEYDIDNDMMNIFARKDENGNGKREDDEAIHIFSIDLKNPKLGLRLY